MNANGSSNPNNNNSSNTQQQQLPVNAYVSQAQPNAVVVEQQQQLHQQVDPQQQQQYYPQRNNNQHAPIFIPKEAVLTQMCTPTHNFVDITFPPVVTMPQASAYGNMNYQQQQQQPQQFFQNAAYAAYPQQFAGNIGVQQYMAAQQLAQHNFNQQQHHPQHSQQQQQQQAQHRFAQAQQQAQAQAQPHIPQQQQQQMQQSQAPQQPPTQAISAPPPLAKTRKILTITNPETNDIINQDEIQAGAKMNPPAAQSPVAPPLPPVVSAAASEESNTAAIRSQFSKAIANRAGGGSPVPDKQSRITTPVSFGQDVQQNAAETNSTTTTTTTTTVEAAAGSGAHTESTESKEAAADADELLITPTVPPARASSIGVVQQQQQEKQKQLLRSGSTPRESDSATAASPMNAVDLSTTFKEKMKIQSPKGTPSPPSLFQAATPPAAQGFVSSAPASREGSHGPNIVFHPQQFGEMVKEDAHHTNGKTGRQSVENGRSSSPSIVISGDLQRADSQKRGNTPDSVSLAPNFIQNNQNIGRKVRSPSAEPGSDDGYFENGKSGLHDESSMENGISDLAESDAVLGKEAVLKKFEDKMAELMKDPEEFQNVNALVYSSNFLYLMRSICRDLRHAKCPKSELELQDMGIDRAGMPANFVASKGPAIRSFTNTAGRADFVVPWQQTQQQAVVSRPRGNYLGRPSGGNRPQKKDPIISRPSIGRNRVEPPPMPRKSENAWKSRREEKGMDKNAEDAHYEKVKKEIRGLLNKITPSSYETMVQEFCEHKVHNDPKLLPMIIDLIFDKAVEEPRFCPLYSDLCQKQVEMESKLPQDERPQVCFRPSIIQKCQQTFLGANSSDEQIKVIEKVMLEEADERKKSALQEKIDLHRSKEKRRLLGIIKFIAQLYRHNLLINSIINWCVVELVKRYDVTKDDVYIEYAVQMIETVGPTYDKKKSQQGKADQPGPTAPTPGNEEDAIEKIFLHLSQIKATLTNRVRFMIMNLEDLRRNNWQGKHGDTGPKTMDEVRKEAEQDQMDNEAERAAYERKKAMGEFSGKKANRQGYGGRNSMESNSRPPPQPAERRSAAAMASTQSGGTGSSIMKDTKLKQVETQKLGRSGPSWNKKFDPPLSSGNPMDRNNVGGRPSPPASVTPPPAPSPGQPTERRGDSMGKEGSSPSQDKQ